MSKRLILVLALAFVVGIAFAAYAEVQNVKVGGELTTLGVSRYAFDLGGGTAAGRSDASILAMIAKIKIDADLTDAVALTMVLRNERIWGITRETAAGDTDIDLAAAYVTLKEFLNPAVTLKIGQMPVFLGSGLLVADPDTNRVSAGAFNPGYGDLSSRKAFTGGLAVLDYSPLTLTLGALKVDEGKVEASGDDVNAYVVNAAYKIDDKNTAEAYLVTKDDSNKTDVNNYGVRLVSKAIDDLSLTGEFVYQTQKGIRGDKRASSDTGLLLTGNYALPEVTWTPNLGLIYLRVGDNWNSMFEGLTAGDIINAILPLTDCQVIGANVTAKPMEDVTMKLTYVNAKLITAVGSTTLPVWYADNAQDYYTMTSKKDLGNEVDLMLAYDYTEDVQIALSTGYFMPGKAFDKANRKSASQVIGSMKVTF